MLAGRKVHTLSQLASGKQRDFEPRGAAGGAGDATVASAARLTVDWITIGVLASRSDPRASDSGVSRWVSWTLTDYHSDLHVFLHDAAYTTHGLAVRTAAQRVCSGRRW